MIYVSGPMSGLPGFNFPAFAAYTAELREAGEEVFSPHEPDAHLDADALAALRWEDCLRRDLLVVLDARVTEVHVLPGWRTSRGALLETTVAAAVGIPILTARDRKPIARETVFEQGQRAVYGDREKSYGHPAIDFTKTVGAIKALFGYDIAVEHWPLLMIVAKLSRESNSHKEDNLVDIAGYAETRMRLQDVR